ncbi:DUF1684 domain-containing protein [Dyadobacter sp. NIV53]|uniref:DUF1684 domain-containing protein n=1 Tax=Dyadobacter sp. NIV53 TaxID=2861765 RepID=UPI001C86B95F|nr:DUF1684 domain-containing protein [Dyadobacter sp. NIV53]
MKLLFTILIGLFICTTTVAQNFAKETEIFRQKYKQEFIKTDNSPLKKDDLQYLKFYDPDSTFQVPAIFSRAKNSQSFEMPTYSGTKKTFVKYGTIRFRLYGKRQTLTVYRSLSLQTLPQYRDYLFLPFKDKTSGNETYGGGRYIDLKTSDVKDGNFILDFNKAYNPYCAYSEGYNCPIPPKVNTMPVSVEAGEKNFGKEHEVSTK